MYLLLWNLLRGRIGRALIAIGDHPVASATMGINLVIYKTAAFGISAALTGLAGALSAIVVAYVSPDSFSVALSIILLVGLVVGGLASLLVVRCTVHSVCSPGGRLAVQVSPSPTHGGILIVLMLLMPGGVYGRTTKAADRSHWVEVDGPKSRMNVNFASLD